MTSPSAAWPERSVDYYDRARWVWPRLEGARLARARHDPQRLAALIARRTTLPLESILAVLAEPHRAKP